MMQQQYGFGDTTYQAVGGHEGLVKLVDAFYEAMDRLPAAANIRAMHQVDLTDSRDKLACFLSGWMGGPRLYAEKYGRISIPMAHRHLKVDAAGRDAWMLCMQKALAEQAYPEALQSYLMEQLYFPAERIRQVSEMHHHS